jgi:1,2-phenylacetyl-CoA epoxidase catalytic subunit
VAPDLAAAIASVAVAQTNYGQARYFYNWYTGESRAADTELKVDESWNKETTLLNFNKWATWPHLITVMWLVDEAILTLIHDWSREDPALKPNLEKVREELTQALPFTTEWVRIFLQDGRGVGRASAAVAAQLGPLLTQFLMNAGAMAYLPEFQDRWTRVVGGDISWR